MSTTDTKVDELIINTLTKAQYDDLVANNQVETNQLYLTKDEDYYMQVDITYGTTTYAQITLALGAKQEPICTYNNYRYRYVYNDGVYYYFTCVVNNTIKYVRVSSVDAWDNGELNINTIINNIDTKVDKDSLERVHVVIETYVNGTSWYRIYDDGWCEQGGRLENTSTSVTSYLYIGFLQPFKDANYSVQISPYGGKIQAGSNNLAIGVSDTTYIGMNILMYGVDYKPSYISWEAKGYIG